MTIISFIQNGNYSDLFVNLYSYWSSIKQINQILPKEIPFKKVFVFHDWINSLTIRQSKPEETLGLISEGRGEKRLKTPYAS